MVATVMHCLGSFFESIQILFFLLKKVGEGAFYSGSHYGKGDTCDTLKLEDLDFK